MARHSSLELTWEGKHDARRPAAHILREVPAKSYPVAEHDRGDNLLIRGDNLPALAALEPDFTGRVKCVYIDPPFNTQRSFEHYDDGLGHPAWLSAMRDRLAIIHRLLRDDGTLAVHIGDSELPYLTVLLDELFGRANRASLVSFKQASATGHKAINAGPVTVANYVLLFAKDKSRWSPRRLFTARSRDARYNRVIVGRDRAHPHWTFESLGKALIRAFDEPLSALRRRPDYESLVEGFVMRHRASVVRLARPSYADVGQDVRAAIDASRRDPTRVLLHERVGEAPMYLLDGQRILFYTDKVQTIDGVLTTAEPLTNLWADLLSNNLHREGGVAFPKGKKPEALLKRLLGLFTEPGDLVLDCFGGSGTTAAVAHKMGRRWIVMELGEHCDTHIAPRLRRVIDGQDPSGVTTVTGWKGGGGYRYYEVRAGAAWGPRGAP